MRKEIIELYYVFLFDFNGLNSVVEFSISDLIQFIEDNKIIIC